jgi:hypothetical protein
MPNLPMTDDEMRRRIAIWESGLRNTSEAARQAGVHRTTFQGMLRNAVDRGMLTEADMRPCSAAAADDYQAARTRKIAAFQKKQRKGDWRKPVMTRLPAQPFRLKVFGDPHLDSDGCNFELFEKHWLEMDAAAGVYGVCVGDWFDNWARALGHLWKDTTTAPSDAWLCLEHLMEQRGDALIAACSGNHDDWTQGPADPVDLLMKQYGVLYRKGAIRVAVAFDGLPPMFVAIRHKWKGHSMYSAAHGILRSGIFGWRDHIMIGGHIHKDEPRLLSFDDGFRAHVCQVSAFKQYDDFADTHGFMGPKISPVWDLVVDPRKADTDPDKVKCFWTSEDAAGYLAYLRAA